MTATGRPTVGPARRPEDVAAVRELFLEYAKDLPVDLAFEGFPEEVATLPGAYGAPGGVLLIARDDAGPVGCVGVRPYGPGEAEMKRLYVRPRARGEGIGRRLVEEALRRSAAAGYRALRLDTLPTMTAATVLYHSLGFVEVPEPRPNPVPGTRYFRRRLDDVRRTRGTSK
ncbi:MAG: GNAT family N-acetyltransferase [Thermoplasmata archaeon]